MSDSLIKFFQKYPFWAILIIIFMILPMIGAVVHIILKAMGKKGIDNTPLDETSEPDEEDHSDHQSLDSKK